MKIKVLYKDTGVERIEVYSDAWLRRLFGVQAPPTPDEIDEDIEDWGDWEDDEVVHA